jgi:hypothetical protein
MTTDTFAEDTLREDLEHAKIASHINAARELLAMLEFARGIPAGLGADDPAALGELVTELAAAQGEFGEVRKTKEADAGRYRYRYASLDDIIAAVRPALSKHGIALTQDVETEPGSVSVVTILRRGTASLSLAPITLPAGEDAQAVGSALTYARRYSLATALGITAEEDDDGAASGGAPPAAPRVQAPGKKATEAQMKRLHAVARERGVTHEQMRDWAGSHLGIETLTELTVAGAAEMEKSLRGLPVLPADEQIEEAPDA